MPSDGTTATGPLIDGVATPRRELPQSHHGRNAGIHTNQRLPESTPRCTLAEQGWGRAGKRCGILAACVAEGRPASGAVAEKLSLWRRWRCRWCRWQEMMVGSEAGVECVWGVCGGCAPMAAGSRVCEGRAWPPVPDHTRLMSARMQREACGVCGRGIVCRSVGGDAVSVCGGGGGGRAWPPRLSYMHGRCSRLHPADVPPKQLGPQPVGEHKAAVAERDLAVRLKRLPDEAGVPPSQRPNHGHVEHRVVVTDIRRRPLVEVFELLLAGRDLRRRRVPGELVARKERRKELALLRRDLRRGRQRPKPRVNLLQQLGEGLLVERRVGAERLHRRHRRRLLRLAHHVLDEPAKALIAAAALVQEARVLQQVWEILRRVLQHRAQLVQRQRAVLVHVGDVKEVLRALHRLGLVNSARVAKRKDGPIGAAHTHKLVRLDRSEVLLLRDLCLDGLDERVHGNARRPHARAKRNL
mmetsp:Transcript_3417/g.9534  ORF Transcript_3417/g.9534 Transcript_3417/m.9534 type:complete len:469 (-) Transcript_3417:1006-2412(-)